MLPYARGKKKKVTLRTGFEPVRGDPIGFQVQRLNHSAIAARWVEGRKRESYSQRGYFGGILTHGSK